MLRVLSTAQKHCVEKHIGWCRHVFAHITCAYVCYMYATMPNQVRFTFSIFSFFFFYTSCRKSKKIDTIWNLCEPLFPLIQIAFLLFTWWKVGFLSARIVSSTLLGFFRSKFFHIWIHPYTSFLHSCVCVCAIFVFYFAILSSWSNVLRLSVRCQSSITVFINIFLFCDSCVRKKAYGMNKKSK